MTNTEQFKAEEIIEQNCRVFNDIASEFLLKRQNTLSELDFLKKYLTAGDKVLDIGCGWGRLCQVFENNDFAYTGFDQSSELLKIARKKFPGKKFIEGEMRCLPFADKAFDKVYCVQAFHHILDRKSMQRALLEMKRVLAGSGLIIMTNWNLMGEWRQQKMVNGGYVDIGHNNLQVPWKNNEGKVLGLRYYHAFSEQEFRDLFKECELKLAEIYYVSNGAVSNADKGDNIVTVAGLLV